MAESKSLNGWLQSWDSVKFAASASLIGFQGAKTPLQDSKSDLPVSASGTDDSHERARLVHCFTVNACKLQIANILKMALDRKLVCDVYVGRGCLPWI